MFYEAFLAGIWAAIGSTLGKLSGSLTLVAGCLGLYGSTATGQRRHVFNPKYYVILCNGDSYLIWILLLALMILSNTWGCRYYLRSLDAATNSVAPTVISAASSYTLSGIIGVTVFDEGASVLWWLGVCFIVMGLVLVARPRETKVKNHEE